jgi:tetratricopeptide (TPR) repeat protein
MTRAIAILLALTAVATAEPAKRKATPDKFTKAAGETFQEAVAADQKGDLAVALALYQKANAISPHPNTIYNIADVELRLGRLARAIRSYELYLALAPQASDRKEVEATIDKLVHTPGTIQIVTGDARDPDAVDLKTAYVIVDGEIKVKPGTTASPTPHSGTVPTIEIAVPRGRHVVDIVTPITYSNHSCDVDPGEYQRCHVKAPPRIDGAIVVGSIDRQLGIRTDPRGKLRSRERFELAAGHYKLQVRDRRYECAPIVVDVPSGDDITYVFVSSNDYDGVERCRTLDIKQHRLHFDASGP